MKLKFLIALLFLIGQTSFAQKAEILTNKTVTDLYKAGLDNNIIISKIETSAAKFDLSTAALLTLKKDNVPSDIIKAMMDKASGKTNETVAPPPPVHTAQKKMPDIDMMNIPYLYDAKANAAVALEKNTGDVKGKLALSSLSGLKNIYLFVDGEKSTVRVAPADTLSFLVNAEATPAIFTLYRLTAKKGKREAVYENDGGSKSESKIAFTFKKLKESTYQFYPAEKLVPGEYCLVYDYSIATHNGKQVDLFAFGID